MSGNTTRIFFGALRTARRSILGWTIGAMVVVVFYLAFYPMIGGDDWEQMTAMFPPEVMQAFGMADLSDGAGYANATVYALLGMVIILIFALTFGARLIGGEEESGTLELEYTAPAARRQVYLGRLAALWVGVILAVFGVSLTVWLMNLAASMGIDNGNIWLAGIGMLLATGAFGTIAFAIGAGTGRRSWAIAIAAGLAVVAYLLNAVGPIAGIDWMAKVSPFYWYNGNEPLRNGPSWSGYVWLVLLTIVPAVAGWLAMRRRDLLV